MTGAQSTRGPTVGHGNRWLTAVASLAVGAAFFSLWFWLLPQWLGFSVEMAGAARQLRSLLRNGWLSWVAIAMYETPCTLASQRGGLGCG